MLRIRFRLISIQFKERLLFGWFQFFMLLKTIFLPSMTIKNKRGLFIGFLLFISCTEDECLCTEEYMPVCAGGVQYSNVCKATCAGFEESEISTIQIPQEEIDRGILVSVDCSLEQPF